MVLMGESLGGAVAVDLAARDGARALVLESTFNSLPDVAAYHYPWLPVRWAMRTRFDSAGKIGGYHGPLLQAHGDADTIVPLASAAACSRRPTSRSSFCSCPATTTTIRCRRSITTPWRSFWRRCENQPTRSSSHNAGERTCYKWGRQVSRLMSTRARREA